MEKMLFCHLCKLEFDTAEDISLHTCVEIKQEYVDAKLLDNYDVGRDSNEWVAKESNFSLWFANTSHTSLHCQMTRFIPIRVQNFQDVE